MFSRISRVSRAARPFTSNLRSQRSLHSTQVQSAAAAATAVKQEEDKGIIETYGYVPFFGLAAAALVGKEAFILNEEFMLAINTCSFVFTAYVAVGDGFAKLIEESNKAASDKYHKGVDAVITAMDTYKTTIQRKFDEVDVMKEFIEEQHQAAVNMVNFSNAKIRHAAYNEMITKLASIKAREDAQAAAEFTALVDSTVASVRNAYAGDGSATLKTEALKYAIDNIGKAPKQDPVSAMFIKNVAAAEKSG